MSIKRSLGWMAAAQGSYFALQFLSSVVLARLMTPYEVGIFAVAFATAGLINVIQSLGLNNYLIREIDLSKAVTDTVFTINLAVAVIMSFLIIGFGVASSALFAEPGVRRVLLWLSVMPLLAAPGFVPLALLEREGNFRLVSLIKTLSITSGTLTTLAFAVAKFSYMSFAYGQVVAAAMMTIASIVFAPHHARAGISFRRWREIQRFSLNVLATTGVSRVTSRLQEMLLGRLLGLRQLGLYSRSGNIFSMIWDSIFLVICRIAFVDFADSARKGLPLGPRYEKALSSFTAVMWPAFAGLGILSGPFVYFIYGPKWVAVAMPLSLFCCIGVLYSSIAMTWDLFVIADETGRQAKIEFGRSFICLLLFAAGCLVGIKAAVTARLIDAGIACILYMPHILRITGCQFSPLARVYAQSLLLSIAAILPSAAVMIYYGWDPAAPMFYIGCSVLMGFCLWLAALRAMRHALYAEIYAVVTRRTSRTAPISTRNSGAPK